MPKQHRSFWYNEEFPSVGNPTLSSDITADVCIVGAGIAGLTAAYTLAKAGKDVVILEAGQISRGETGNTTAHLTWVLDDRFFELERLFGIEKTIMALESHSAAIDYVERIVQEEKIDCEFRRLDGYLFSAPEAEDDILDKEYRCLERMENKSFRWVDNAPIRSFNSGRCLNFSNQAEIHPLKYMLGLAKAVQNYGGKIYTNTLVKKVKDDIPCEVVTEQGPIVSAARVIVATNTPINDRFVIHSKQAAYRSYVIAVTLSSSVCDQALYWDTADPYRYIRLSGNKNTLIAGGFDHRTGQGDPEKAYAKLDQWVHSHFPVEQIVNYWSGQIIEPIDGLAFSGKNPGDKHVYIHTGDSGNGITHGTIAGILLPDIILGKHNPWEKLYDPSRILLKAIDEYAKENANTAIQYADWILPAEEEAKIKNECGGVVRDGLCLRAVYRDSSGKLHRRSAVCPHLKGIVRWNDAEKTWDCPCHGSRFKPDGSVINGPSAAPLPSAESDK